MMSQNDHHDGEDRITVETARRVDENTSKQNRLEISCGNSKVGNSYEIYATGSGAAVYKKMGEMGIHQSVEEAYEGDAGDMTWYCFEDLVEIDESTEDEIEFTVKYAHDSFRDFAETLQESELNVRIPYFEDE